MIDQLLEISQACELAIPAAHKRPIAIVGAGSIVENAHLPAYAQLGLEVTGIFDIDRKRAERLAAAFRLPRVYATLGELLADERVGLVDVALPPAAQPAVIREALAAGRHVLAQKPLALSSAAGEELMVLADRQGVHLAVNQQLRFDEGIMAARAMLERGWIGTPVGLEMSIIRASPWRSWYKDAAQLELWYHAIHEIDAIRSWFGTPASVWCSGGRTPGQDSAGETNVFCGFHFSDTLHGVFRDTSENRAGANLTRFRIDGSEGAIEGDLGRFLPAGGARPGRPDRLRVWSRTLPTEDWLPYPCTKRWFLDAFAGPIGSLLRAIATRNAPYPGGRDHVQTLRLIEALYASMATGRAQTLAPDPAT